MVVEVGPGVTEVAVGDHVVTSFIPSCGRCPSCASGKQNLCDNGAHLLSGHQADGTSRHHTLDGHDIATMCCLGTFAEHSVMNLNSHREDRARPPARQGLPRRLRRHHRLGLGHLRRPTSPPARPSSSSATAASA